MFGYCHICNQTIEVGSQTTTDGEGRRIHLNCSHFVRQPWQP